MSTAGEPQFKEKPKSQVPIGAKQEGFQKNDAYLEQQSKIVREQELKISLMTVGEVMHGVEGVKGSKNSLGATQDVQTLTNYVSRQIEKERLATTQDITKILAYVAEELAKESKNA